MEKHNRCPNCGRALTENEMHCYFCEIDLSKFKKTSGESKKIKKIIFSARK